MHITNKRLHKKLMIFGGIFIAFSILLAFITLFSVYGKAGEGLDATSGYSPKTDNLLADIAVWLRGIGIVVFMAGFILFVISRTHNNKR